MFALEIKIDSLTLKSLGRSVARGKALELSNRRNVFVIADEAHRTQYDLIDGLARNLRDSLPTCRSSASPAHRSRRRTAIRAWSSAITSASTTSSAPWPTKATVAIYYESRVAKLGLDQNDLPNIDQEFEAIIEGKKLREERMGHANSSRSRIFRALRKSSSHHATSPVCRGGLTSWSFLRAFVASAWTTRKW